MSSQLNNLQEMLKMRKIQMREMIAAVWILQVKLNNNANIQITNPHLSHLLVLNHNLINSHQEQRNIDKEILMEVTLG